MPRRLGGIVVAITLQLLAVVLAHELIFLARYGSRYGEALVHAGHGESWSTAVGTSLLLALLLASMATFRLVRLGLLVRRNGPARDRARGTLELGLLLRIWLRTGPRLALVGTALLSVQENIEHGGIGLGMPGPGILLTPEYAGGLWIALAVGLAVGLIAALFEWRRRVLIARLRTGRRPFPRSCAAPARTTGVAVLPPAVSMLGRRLALRAPPVGASC
jgi:hypothetical protein